MEIPRLAPLARDDNYIAVGLTLSFVPVTGAAFPPPVILLPGRAAVNAQGGGHVGVFLRTRTKKN